MPRERDNVEIVRALCADWDQGNYDAAEWADPGIEFVIADGPAPGRWLGHEGMATGWRSWLQAWDDFQQRTDEVREIGNDRVLALYRGSGRGKVSGLELAHESRYGIGVFDLRDGKVTRFLIYFNGELGLAELGITE
jgi:hypothetical protein